MSLWIGQVDINALRNKVAAVTGPILLDAGG